MQINTATNYKKSRNYIAIRKKKKRIAPFYPQTTKKIESSLYWVPQYTEKGPFVLSLSARLLS